MTNTRITIGICIAAALAVFAAGCSDSSDKAADTPTSTTNATTTAAPGDSDYCQAARAWAAHDLSPFDDSSVPQTKKYFDEYVAFNDTRAETAPAAIREDAKVNDQGIHRLFVPMLVKYGYSIERIGSEGTEAEQALFDHPPADIQTVQDHLHAYEADVCAAGQPAAAGVTFTGPGSKDYCHAVGEFQGALDEVAGNGAKPKDLKAPVTSDAWDTGGQAVVDAAPPEIRTAVETQHRFENEVQVPVVAKYGYDLRKLFIEGSQHDREVFNYLVPEVRSAFTRVLAYENQLCSGEGS